MHRTYHVSRMPTFNRKVRVLADWTAALFFRREVVSLGQLQSPRTEFETGQRPALTVPCVTAVVACPAVERRPSAGRAGYPAGARPRSPMAEAADLKSAQCRFESDRGYRVAAA